MTNLHLVEVGKDQPTAIPERPMRVALVNMPWALADRPSIQCGLLKSELARHGHEVDVHYLNLGLASALGADRYARIADLPAERAMLLGEWLFTVAAFGPRSDEAAYQAAFPDIEGLCAGADLTVEDVCRLRSETLPAWLSETFGAIPWPEYDLVGFTSTFEQHVAVLAGAAAVKRHSPELTVVVGGANVDGDMGPEYLRCFPDIDYVVVGEGDESFPRLVAALSREESPADIAGVCSRNAAAEIRLSPPRQVRDLNQVPVPDYDDYFAALRELGEQRVLGARDVRLLVEFSRGCWWGEKHHCTFCGLNALGMAYRSKSPRQAAAELIELAGTSRQLRVFAVDNILDMRYVTEFCDELSEHDYDLSMFFETKANLTADQLGRLRRAGVKLIQPGIESLSTRVLRIMDKGTDLLTNVRLLKWARHHRISVAWNVLTGFPGETEADYTGQADLIPALHHLQPPSGVVEMWLERFSPYFVNPPDGFHNIRPSVAYSLIYPPELDLSKIAYFFDYDKKDKVAEPAQTALRDAVEAWRRRWESARTVPVLFSLRGPGWIRIVDSRWSSPHDRLHEGWAAAAYLGCGETPRTPAALARRLAGGAGSPTESQVAAFLDECVKDRTMISERGRYLSLALPTAR